MKFLEKNNHVIRLKSESHFDADYNLFKRYFPSHQLNRDLEKVNQFNRARLDGQMIMLLLDKVSPQSIEKFRVEYSPNELAKSKDSYDPYTIASIDEAKALFCEHTGWPMNSIDAVSIIKTAVGLKKDDFIKTATSSKHYMIFKNESDNVDTVQSDKVKKKESDKKKVNTKNSPK
ncbi:hypothetical protein ACOMSG_13340 [Macellibacteroides fermentans]|uniref:hypothetical protein n=1 Tax=Macellibacteroides fermentans TaxID=879969 RepID=UPI003B93CEB2